MSTSHLSPLSASLLLSIACIVVVYLRSLADWRARTKGRPLPPGPSPLPVVGNLLNTPTVKPWVAFRDVCSTYGRIVHFRVFGQSIVVLGSADVIFEYLEKRSSNTSGRKQSPLIELTGIYSSFAFMQYGQYWRRHRKAFWQFFHRDASISYQPIQRVITHKFLELLLDDPKEVVEHIRYTFAATVLRVIYGYQAEEENDQFVALAESAMEAVAQGLVPGKFLVENIPALQYLPSWFPGQGWQKLFAKWRAARDRAKNLPLDFVKSRMDKEEVRDSIVGQLLTECDQTEKKPQDETEVIKNVGAVAFEAGADTTWATLQAAFLALALNPDVKKKAQNELDAVVGPGRLPDYSDQESLVYVSAIVMEALRWHNVVPLAVPHQTTEDDELHGYFIPAGTIVIPNTWACMHDPEVFPDPEAFRPERFIKDGKLDVSIRDPTTFSFGYGRRICPGRHFALAALFINIASVLHVFDLSPAVDENGRPIHITPTMSDGFLSYLEDSRCTIKPRSAEAEALIRANAAAARVQMHA
ncbi:cytochrome P450 [Epithele typhae]|uniref:cytochrome P450 n=1 Tax=Epithele typhae TaxID=378194 RepID=UPI002007806C|nr:cytochrome P450 [Epithele typhae]KAH9929089.1 cytochrome P450 [Epithele typhae]